MTYEEIQAAIGDQTTSRVYDSIQEMYQSQLQTRTPAADEDAVTSAMDELLVAALASQVTGCADLGAARRRGRRCLQMLRASLEAALEIRSELESA